METLRDGNVTVPIHEDQWTIYEGQSEINRMFSACSKKSIERKDSEILKAQATLTEEDE